jgi:hypothetical protein
VTDERCKDPGSLLAEGAFDGDGLLAQPRTPPAGLHGAAAACSSEVTRAPTSKTGRTSTEP